MSRDSDQGLRRSARVEENKYIGPINCGSFRRRPLFTILHIELLFRTLFMAIQTYTRFFRALLLFECASNAGRVIDAKYGIVEIIV